MGQLPDFASTWNDEETPHTQFEPRLAAALARLEREISGPAAVARIQTIAAGGVVAPAYLAEGTISALHAVVPSSSVGRIRISNDTDWVLGISTSSAQAGSAVMIQQAGEMSDASWSWAVGKVVFATPSGQLTQTVPVSGVLRAVGVALSPTRLLIQIATPITLG